ncbi:hypothetical protein HZS_5558, partial [Henneguya salminicola]
MNSEIIITEFSHEHPLRDLFECDEVINFNKLINLQKYHKDTHNWEFCRNIIISTRKVTKSEDTEEYEIEEPESIVCNCSHFETILVDEKYEHSVETLFNEIYQNQAEILYAISERKNMT